MPELEQKVEKIEAALVAQHNTLKRLINAELALRSFALAVMRQPNLDHCRLLEDYDKLSLQALEQLPPGFQLPDQIEELAEPLRTSCQAARSRGTTP